MFRQNKHGFFFPSPPRPPPPPTIASHERLSLQPLRFPSAVVSQVLCHTVTSGFLMPSCGFARYVRSHSAKRTEAAPVTNNPRNPRPTRRGTAWPEASHVRHLAWHPRGARAAFAWRLHGACTAFARFVRPLARFHHPPSSWSPPGALTQLGQEAEEGPAEEGFVSCFSSVSPLLNPA